MKRGWTRKLALALVLPLLLLVAALTFALNSRSGAQWVVDRLVAMSGSQISYAQLHGTLSSGLSFSGLRYRDEDRQADIENLVLNISWRQLLARTLMLEEVRASRIRHLETGPGSGEAGLQLALPQWPFTLCVGHLHVDEARSGEGDSQVVLEAVTAAGLCIDGDDHALRIKSAGLATSGAQFEAVNLEASIQGAVPLSSELAWQYPEEDWSGSGFVSGTLERLELRQEVAGPYPFDLGGTVAPFDGPAPLLDLNAKWQAWTVEDVVLQSGEAQLSGTLDDYTLSYRFDALVPELPVLKVDGNGEGDLGGLARLDATAQSDIGSVRYEGFLEWSDLVRSEGRLSVSGFDPAWLNDKLSGSVDGTSAVVLQQNDDTRFVGFNLHGAVNGSNLKLTGDARIGPESTHCQSCRLQSGRNEVLIDGVLEDNQLDARLEVRAPDLAAAWPGLEGRFNAEGSLGGSINSPVFTGRAGGVDLAYAGWTLARLNINSGLASERELRFSMSAQDLSYQGSPPALVTAEASGSLNALDLALDWTSSGLDAALRSRLNLHADGIEADILSAQIHEPQVGTWALDQPFSLQSTAKGTTLSASLWRNGDSEIRVHDLSLREDQTLIRASLGRWSLANLQPLLAENQQLRGTAEAEVDIVQHDGAWSGTVGWRQSGTVLVASVPGNAQAEIRIPRAQLDLELVGGGATATAQLDIEPDVRAEVRLEADQLARDANINGNIVLTGQDWSWVSAVVPELDRLDGDISANIQLTGPLLAPNIQGSLDWRQGRIMIPALNITLEEVGLSLTGEPNGAVSLTGSARAGQGGLEIDGLFEQILTAQRSARVSISGDTAELLDWPEYHVWVSPDIDIQSVEEGWELQGKLALPRADVRLRELPENAVTISEDVRVLGAEEPALRPTRYFGEARVSLGDQVRVQLFGLDTRLSGDLSIRVPKGRPPTATGQVSLVGGTFEAYGQKLQIEQGTLLFTGPFDNPVVDVRAVRIIETFDGPVTAGIHLQGRALNISSRVYSVPTMAEADALSYLVIGRPLNQVSDAESADVSNAAIALGLGQASKITQQIGDRLGLDQLNLVGDGGEGTALVAGKQINKRLYARYAYGVFSRLGTLLLRYKLSRRVAIEATSGERQSLDILYTVEKQ